jgi:hypothetical protein
MPAIENTVDDPTATGRPLPITAGQLRELLATMPADKPLLIHPLDEDGQEALVSGVGVQPINWDGDHEDIDRRHLVLHTVPAPEWLSSRSRRHEKIETATDVPAATPAAVADDVQLPPFTEASRARITLADALAELADRAAAFVPIYGSTLRPDGTAPAAASTISEVAGLVFQARQVLILAVVTARLGRTTWEEVGQALEVTGPSAQQRFGGDVERFRDELLSPENPHYTGEFGEIRYRLAPAALDPAEAAARLDEWVRRHQAADGEIPDPAPVSGGLARMDPHAELAWISDLSHDQWARAEAAGARGVPPLAGRLHLAQRTLVCWERIAAGQQRVSRPVRDGLTLARRALAELQEQATTAAIATDSSAEGAAAEAGSS